MTKFALNQELNGVEIFFDKKPAQDILEGLKAIGFRWSNFKKCWYAKQNEKTLAKAQELTNNKITVETTETVTEKKIANKSKNNMLSLWNRVQFVEGENKSDRNYKFVGSNYTGLSVKETATEIRKHLKAQFPEVKFSVTSDYNHIRIEIKSSPYNWGKLAYSPELECKQYRDYEEEHNKELIAIKEYCSKLLDSYNWDDSDSQSDYFNCHYYDSVSIDYKYNQTEQTEQVKADIIAFKNKLIEEAQAEEERKEIEYQKRLIEQEEGHKQYLLQIEEEKKQTEIINNSVTVSDLDESNQYFIIGSQFAKLNKNCTIAEYKEEIAKGEFNLEDIKITKEIHFNDVTALEYFSNMLLHDFDFLEHTGGSFTDDVRIQTMTDYYNMDKEEKETVKWNLYGVAVYINNELQYVIDAQGYSYARYVGLVNNVKIQKDLVTEQVLTAEQVVEYKDKADSVEDISFNIIADLGMVKTWNNENWTEYKELMKEQLKDHNIKLSKPIIQQLTEDSEMLKVAMYKLLTEVDGIQEQFKNADLKQGQKLTMFYISDWGSIVTNRIILDKIEYKKYAQYDNAVKITYKPQGKRNLYYSYHYSTMLVYDGWLELPVTVLHDVKQTEDFVMTSTKYASCDKKQYDEIINHFITEGRIPIINTYKPIF